jgi:hypothetical protein
MSFLLRRLYRHETRAARACGRGRGRDVGLTWGVHHCAGGGHSVVVAVCCGSSADTYDADRAHGAGCVGSSGGCGVTQHAHGSRHTPSTQPAVSDGLGGGRGTLSRRVGSLRQCGSPLASHASSPADPLALVGPRLDRGGMSRHPAAPTHAAMKRRHVRDTLPRYCVRVGHRTDGGEVAGPRGRRASAISI